MLNEARGMFTLTFVIVDDLTWLAKNLSNPRQIQKQAVMSRKRTRDPENPTSIERPRKHLQTQDPLQTEPLAQVEKQKRPRDDTLVYHPSYEPFLERTGEPSDRTKPQKQRIRSSSPNSQKTTGKDTIDSGQNFINHWATEKTWPKEYFEDDKMYHLLARKKSSVGQQSSCPSLVSSFAGASDERPREEKSAPYRNPNYPNFLCEDVGNYKSYMRDHEFGISDASKKLLDRLLYTKQSPPKDTLFRDDVFDKHRQKLKGKNESRLLQDLSPLLVPSAEAFASFGAKHLNGVIESVNEGWNNCYPITKTRPQPDGAFGYERSAFSDNQLDKLRPTLGDPSFFSYFKATYYMLFPFLIKEVKTGIMGLDTADNQNLHSATIAVRAVVELFKLVGREKELHQEIVALTISHDDQSIRLYAHYPIIDGDKVTIWRHTADQYYLNPKTKWNTWTFTKNVFDIFSTMNLKRIRSIIDDIPPGPTHISQEPESQTSEHPSQPLEDRNPTSEPSGLSQQLRHQPLNEGGPEMPVGQQITPNTSIQTGAGSPRRKKNKKT
jgi:hypothetical protein